MAHRPAAVEELVKFKVIVAIDFGTHGTGLGFAMVPKDDEKINEMEEEIYVEQDWCKNSDHKNKTDILLTWDGKFKAFGEDALEAYMNQDDDETDSEDEYESDSEDEDEKNQKKLAQKDMLFESFKMALYEKKQDGSDGDIRGKIACEDGRLFSTSTVFIEALKFIKNHIFETFHKKQIVIPKGIDDIQWILTVPAIWSDRAKHKMDVWAQKAKLVNKKIYNHLRIVYEPDCASISCQSEVADQDQKSNDNSPLKKFGAGERYVLIDAGGGTVDIAWHQVQEELSMEELHHATGGPWGSDYIDDHFDNLLIEIFSKDALHLFKEKFTANYTKIKDNFRKSKMTFYNKPNEKFHQVKLSSEFMDEIPQFGAKSADDMDTLAEFNKTIHNARPYGIEAGHLKMDGERLHISCKIWRECLFDKVINPMIAHVQQMIPQINATTDKNGNTEDIKYLCIAGGLASSNYFQYRIHETFGHESKYKLSIRIPRRPILSVIHGALKLGLKPNYIKTRRLKYTYGIAVDRSQKNVDLNRLPPRYLDDNSYVHPNTHKRTVRNLFSKWVSQNDPIDIGQAITKQYRRFHRKEKTAKLSIYCSSKADPYIVEGQPLASVSIPFPEQYVGLPFTVQFYFGDTKISAKVLYKDNKAKDEEHVLSDKLELKYEIKR